MCEWLLTGIIPVIILLVYSILYTHKNLNAEGQERVCLYWLTHTGFKSKLCGVYMRIRGWKLQ